MEEKEIRREDIGTKNKRSVGLASCLGGEILAVNTYGKSLSAYVGKTVILAGGQTNLKGKEPVQYTVEREYLAKYSVEELLIRIIRSHLNQDIAKENLTK
ncbi:MAG: hypothetical protein HFI74_13235 [Lachnospiraceae bacterium]|jgi:hypothetical protein|nr:hypothetical protein [Lachnospiraceae bacterium]